MTVKSILLVCRGNICRSPMAEGFFSHQLNNHQSQIVVSSAGLTALVNEPADQHAQSVMQEHNINILKHRARQLTASLVRHTNLIIVMSQSQLQMLTQQFPAAKGKTFIIGHWQGFDISDPFRQPREKFEYVYKQIEFAWQAWKTRILSC